MIIPRRPEHLPAKSKRCSTKHRHRRGGGQYLTNSSAKGGLPKSRFKPGMTATTGEVRTFVKDGWRLQVSEKGSGFSTPLQKNATGKLQKRDIVIPEEFRGNAGSRYQPRMSGIQPQPNDVCGVHPRGRLPRRRTPAHGSYVLLAQLPCGLTAPIGVSGSSSTNDLLRHLVPREVLLAVAEPRPRSVPRPASAPARFELSRLRSGNAK